MNDDLIVTIYVVIDEVMHRPSHSLVHTYRQWLRQDRGRRVVRHPPEVTEAACTPVMSGCVGRANGISLPTRRGYRTAAP